MAKVILFSRRFPKGHVLEGKPTLFVEKIYAALRLEGMSEEELKPFLDGYADQMKMQDVFDSILSVKDGLTPKYHTIRRGNRFKVGDTFSPRVWSGTPYRSKQVVIAPDITVKAVFDFKIDPNHPLIVGVKKDDAPLFRVHYHLGKATEAIAYNDGLTLQDFASWFGDFKKPFVGQIICWTDKLNYGS